MDPKVSVIVPVYNVEKYLDRCVKSLLAQSLKDIEMNHPITVHKYVTVMQINMLI